MRTTESSLETLAKGGDSESSKESEVALGEANMWSPLAYALCQLQAGGKMQVRCDCTAELKVSVSCNFDTPVVGDVSTTCHRARCRRVHGSSRSR